MSTDLRHLRVRDRLIDCPVYLLEDGRRALRLWYGFEPPTSGMPNLRWKDGYWFYVLDEETLAALIVDALGDSEAGERKMGVLRRMVTADEWAIAEDMARNMPRAVD